MFFFKRKRPGLESHTLPPSAKRKSFCDCITWGMNQVPLSTVGIIACQNCLAESAAMFRDTPLYNNWWTFGQTPLTLFADSCSGNIQTLLHLHLLWMPTGNFPVRMHVSFSGVYIKVFVYILCVCVCMYVMYMCVCICPYLLWVSLPTGTNHSGV